MENKGEIRSEGKERIVLVTGGGGYLGSVLVPLLLEQGYQVRVLDVFFFGKEGLASCADHPKLEILNSDVFYHEQFEDLLRGVHSIIHLASLSNDPSCDLDPNLSIRTNFLATLSLARRAKKEGVSRFLFASSCSVYGAQGDLLLNEESAVGPVTLYAIGKLECERELKELADEKFVVCLPRLATLFGYSPRMRFDLAVNVMTKRAILNEGLILNGDGKQYRPFVHVRDAAQVFIKFMQSDAEQVNGQIFNIGNPVNNFTIANLCEKIRQLFPDVSIGRIKDNVDPRSYRIDFTKYETTFGELPTTTVLDAVKEITQAYEQGRISDMNSTNYYNILVMKKQALSVKLPDLAGPSFASIPSRFKNSIQDISSETIQKQALASIVQKEATNE